MQNKIFFSLVLALSVGLINISAQESPKPPSPKILSGGVLNGKAQTLTKPRYPAAAIAVNASGAVNVQVTIDENGNVISASAVSGHPLLRQASEQAALASKFAPTLLEGQPVKITGIIVYNFVSGMTYTQIGYELALAEKSKVLSSYQATSITETFPNSWTEEREMLSKLKLQPVAKSIEKTPPTPITLQEKTGNLTFRGADRAAVLTVATDGSTGSNISLDADSVEIIRQLQISIENRLNINNQVLTAFRFGKILGNLKAEIDDAVKTQTNISELNQFSKTNLSNISEPVQTKINEIVEFSQKDLSDKAAREKLSILIQNLRNVRI